MKTLRHAPLLLFGALLLLAGCGRSNVETAPAPTPPTQPKPGYLDHAQPRLATVKLWLGSNELAAEVARTAVEIQTGMMFRTNVAETDAMIFVFPQPFRVAFYMRNTKVPLSCAYIDLDGTILELHDLKPLDETPVEAGTDKVQFVLETSLGWFQRHNVGVGTVVRTEHAALRDLNWVTLRPARSR